MKSLACCYFLLILESWKNRCNLGESWSCADVPKEWMKWWAADTLAKNLHGEENKGKINSSDLKKKA